MSAETPKSEFQSEIEKPSILYHGSRNRNIEKLEPRQESYRDFEDGKKLFATKDLALATIFMSGAGEKSGLFEDVPYVVIPGTEEEFMNRDKGGRIYVLPSDTFSTDPSVGLGEYEWTSEEKVKPEKIMEYPFALDAMLEAGVQVYFVDKNTFKKIEGAHDEGRSILADLQSENRKRGINVKEFSPVEK